MAGVKTKTKRKAKAKARPAKRPTEARRGKALAKKRPANKAATKPANKRAPKAGLSGKNAAVFKRAAARAEVEGLLSRLPPPVAPIVKTLRQLVLEAAPEAVERIEDGVPSYFAGGMFARIEPHERDVLIKFIRGAELPSSAVLQTDGQVGTATLSSIDAVRASVLRTLVREAVLLNLSKSPVKPDAPLMPAAEGQALA
jgi:hypothetical protein